MLLVTRRNLPLWPDLEFDMVAAWSHIVVVVERNHDFILPKNFALSSAFLAYNIPYTCILHYRGQNVKMKKFQNVNAYVGRVII
ncbi:MAG: hypothetical protein EBZ49_08505 [Proteobacteria bacterium]|nr:hypothetical protein [Pseudomonadota bacterium]